MKKRKSKMKHKLKCLPAYFDVTWQGYKQFELRKNDRNFLPGDIIILNEWTEKDGFSGRSITSIISYIIQDERWLQKDICCIGLMNFEFVE